MWFKWPHPTLVLFIAQSSEIKGKEGAAKTSHFRPLARHQDPRNGIRIHGIKLHGITLLSISGNNNDLFQPIKIVNLRQTN
jgi:hypothetical protein